MSDPLTHALDLHAEREGRPPTVLVDMDDVLCRWEDHFVSSRRRLFPHIPVADAGSRESFDLFTGFSEEERAATVTVVDEPGFFAALEPVPGGVEAVGEMVGAGIDVAVCTSPWLSNPTCASDKLRWVQEHLGAELADATVITRDKTRVLGDVLIDDKPQVTGAVRPRWSLLRFTRHYNRLLAGPRIDDWSQWRAGLARVLADRLEGRPRSR
ncbi:hypothetical protein ACFVWN_29395 [Nocardiopsis flavescens]|uniref:5'-nucleotidase n=1 Tax=Nocardiopsis flavescens TaxID=758803 RepID=A0A1M6CXN5_9ACTN|nr:hypothetical protein [Nocardiopsis flavescens]SHI65611.1 5'-nucleotidase [Nocardiopsis flavescens]